ncbi:DNA-binding response regulator [Cohnella xylanilytica]|uniref:response regulator transcription factor n=1 Tax=Cohnella xylanilytica TaxID=557555 RepID=UPI001B097D1F|nr:response regulator transcription factor [Cohnella xylanilytica]GIO15641.1 DNA-binding response regulator [Cohnella xylanilytica]
MIKVLIVDDEPKLRQGLQTLIPWESLGFTVAATAANGAEALTVVEDTAPDLALVDIRMPVMDGLQLIERLTSAGHSMQFIILSGYADFEYAKQAIQFGVAGYLLKPVNTSELTAGLMRVRERIEENRSKLDHRRLEAAEREWALNRLLDPRKSAEDPAALKRLALEAELSWNRYEVVVIQPQVPEAERSDAPSRLSVALKPVVEGRGRGIVAVRPPYAIVLLREPLRGRQQREELYREIRNAAGDVRFVAATGGAVSGPEEVGASYSGAQEAIKRAFFSEKERLLEPNSPPYFPPNSPLDSSPDSPRLPEDNAQEAMEELVFRLHYSLDVGNRSMILPLLNEAAALFLKQGQDEKGIKESFFILTNAVIHKLTAGSRQGLKNTEAASRFLNGIYHQAHLHDLLEEIHRFLLSLAEDSGPGGKEQDLKKMIDFIHRHYADNLRLETLAGLLNYSSAYLGQLFKNKTGEYFNTYLDRVRIRKAKELLSKGMKVYEAAERVGYTNVNYFYSKFKKYEGRSPSDYKNP